MTRSRCTTCRPHAAPFLLPATRHRVECPRCCSVAFSQPRPNGLRYDSARRPRCRPSTAPPAPPLQRQPLQRSALPVFCRRPRERSAPKYHPIRFRPARKGTGLTYTLPTPPLLHLNLFLPPHNHPSQPTPL